MAEILTPQQEQSVPSHSIQQEVVQQENIRIGEMSEQGAERQESQRELLYQQIVSQTQSAQASSASDSDAELDAKHIVAMTDMKAQVEQLTHLAELKGTVYAVSVARKLDFYVLDQLHDQLANAFYEELVKRGVIEKE